MLILGQKLHKMNENRTKTEKIGELWELYWELYTKVPEPRLRWTETPENQT